MNYPECSEKLKKYFDELTDKTNKGFDFASEARKRNLDPVDYVEIKLAEDVAGRVEGLIGPEGISHVIRSMENEGLSRQVVAAEIVKKIVRGEVIKKPKEELLDLAVRVGVGVLTEGVLVAPTEGIAKIKIAKNADGSERIDVYFAGPIRSAGGTIAALSVVLADIARIELDVGKYQPTESEIERYVEEIDLYDRRCARLQYRPTEDEIRIIIKNTPICINGEPTNDIETSVHRNVHGVSTNKVRGGVALVVGEGIAQKAPKILKYAKKVDLKGWEWVEKIVKVKKKKTDEKIKPLWTFISELIAGRPVFAYPSTEGGFRLRYGRSPLTGIMSKGFNPATLEVLDGFLAIGTQAKIERPGKGCVVTVCEHIEGPVVLMEDNSVKKLKTREEVQKLKPQIKKVLFVGDMLVPIGDMLKSGHPIIPNCWCEEWWDALLKNKNIANKKLEGWELVNFSFDNELPLHPKLTKPWVKLTEQEIDVLKKNVEKKVIKGNQPEILSLNYSDELVDVLKELLVEYHIEENEVHIDEHPSALIVPLGFWKIKKGTRDNNYEEGLKTINDISPLEIKNWVSYYIGVRMGRPEKAKMREMKPSIHTLFPVGEYDRMRNVVATVKNLETNGKSLYIEIAKRKCVKCGTETVFSKCDICGEKSIPSDEKKYDKKAVNLSLLWKKAISDLNISPPQVVKGVRGMMSSERIPERLEKGILRAKHGISMYKDGTCRFDATDIPLTHFRPKDIGTSIEKLHELGYDKDCYGNSLETEDQIIEIFPQDIVVNEEIKEGLFKTANFVDELLERFYKVEPYYKLRDQNDIIGHLCIGLAPHISAGTIVRVIGSTKIRGTLGHPYFHMAKRRNCDGDEDAIMLLVDALLNFSFKFKPEIRGGTMDMPIVLTAIINPKEIDDEVFSMEISNEYPLSFFESAEKFESNLEGIKFVQDVLGKPEQYEGFGFTKPVDNMGDGPVMSRYVKFKTMREKVFTQLEIQDKIKAVDNRDAAEKVILSHFIPDLYGNLRKFSQQTFRCVQCNQKYRRVPMKGKCLKCGGKLVLTIHEGSVKKYLKISKEITERYSLPEYLKQRLMLLEKDIDSIFIDEQKEQLNLTEFL
ncbi:DNA polymerase II large subunit [Candidatus Micrarchaeota archaeon]|nr:DNA polymerase II large subunit [Candidatus Micrarchaeota archaeon]